MLMARTLRRMLEQQGGIKVEIISADELMERHEKPGPSGSAMPLRPGFGASRLGAWATTLAMTSVVVEPPEGEQTPDTETPETAADTEPTVVIAVDPATNALMVIGAPRLTDRIAGLVVELQSQMPSEPTGVRIVTLPDTADARGVADVVTQTVRQVGTATATNPGGFTGRVAVRPDPSGKAVVVWANETDFRAVSEIIAGVASLADSVEMTIKVYPLANVTARQALTSVQDLFAASPRGRQAQQLRKMTLRGEDGTTLKATINPLRVKVISDPSETSLIVAAPGEAFDLIDRFITLIDQPRMVASKLRVRIFFRKTDHSSSRTSALIPNFFSSSHMISPICLRASFPELIRMVNLKSTFLPSITFSLTPSPSPSSRSSAPGHWSQSSGTPSPSSSSPSSHPGQRSHPSGVPSPSPSTASS